MYGIAESAVRIDNPKRYSSRLRQRIAGFDRME